MKSTLCILVFLLLQIANCYAQAPASDTIWVGTDKNGEPINKNIGHRSKESAKWADGYIVYKSDTMKGLIMMYSKFEILFQKVINEDYSYYYKFNKANTDLQTIMMYNGKDKKPVCFTRIKKRDKKLMRVIHDGKLSIYDDRVGYIYDPKDIDKNLIVIAYNDTVEDLSSFFTENTKRDLIVFVNDIYGLKIDPKTITWKELLVKVDMLD